MIDKKKAFIFAIPFLFAIAIIQPAFAQIEKGKDFDRELLQTFPNGTALYQWTSQPARILDNGQYKDYILTEDSQTIKLETGNAGSLVFDKVACNYDLYKPGKVGTEQPSVKDVSWIVKGKLSSSTTWSNVNSVNNAACTFNVSSSPQSVTITATKTAATGTFEIKLDYVPGQGIKETMRAYNNNLAWNDHHIGFSETFEVPRFIEFGGSQYDLANFNNVTFGRTWIENNEAKIFKLTNELFYDFGIGFENLEKVRVTWNGAKAYLTMDYLFTDQIVPYQQWFEVDPTFNAAASAEGRVYDTGASANCASLAGTTASATLTVSKVNVGSGCQMVWTEYNIASIPSTAFVNTAYFEWDQTGTTSWTQTCGIYAYATQPSTLTTAQKYSQGWAGVGGGTSALCTSDGNNKQLTINATGRSNLQANISGAEGWWGFMFQGISGVADGTNRFFDMTAGQNRLNVVYFSSGNPDSVQTLAASQTGNQQVQLSWTAPSLGPGSLLKYTINYTTPFGAPLTILTNNSGTGTSHTVNGLTTGANYSFRAGVQTNMGHNMSGNIANITMSFIPANFTIGSLNIDSINTDVIGIQFQETDINSTATRLKVIYDENYDMNCEFSYRLAQTSDTYTNISPSVYDADQNYTDFTFLNPNRDVINARCWDQSSNDTGTYVISQSSFVLLEMVNNFRNGTYGTMGQFGALDLITLVVIIVSMIGFNRVSPVVGVIFCSGIIFFTSWFGIITWPTIFASALALIIALAIASSRKD